ncbi:MAG: FlgD immunoglobulin-like domain containing protein [Candidatus Cloacimonadaceae bacterium]|nr:FlgD immunoglobulin-like domain containing protein [Candidatus Cloacimonadaceae bacterium]
MKRIVLSILLMVAILLISAQEIPLRKAWQVDWKGSQVRTADNSVIALWEDTDAGDTDIYAQKLNAAGDAQWPEPIILAGGPGVQEIVACESTSDHNFVLLYHESGHGFESGLWIQKFSTSDQSLWGENGVKISSSLFNPRLVANQVGGAYVVYANYSQSRKIIGHNLDSSGNLLWPAAGLILATHDAVMDFDDVVSDGEGGIILNVNKQIGGDHVTQLTRYSPLGTVIGNNPLLPPAAFPGFRYSILPDASGNFVLWNVSYPPAAGLVLHRMDNMGNLLLTSPQVSSIDFSNNYFNRPEMRALADGGLMLSYELHSAEESKLMLARFDSSYDFVWDFPGVQIASSENPFWRELRLSVSDAGGAWLSWVQRDEEYGPRELRAQYVTPAGVPAWGNNGIVLRESCTEIGRPVPLTISEQGMFLWCDQVDTQIAVRRQIVSTAGIPILTAGGAAMVSRLTGIASLMTVAATGDKYLVFWSDRRRDWNNIYYQLCDAEMNPLLEPEGRPLYPPLNSHFEGGQVLALPDGSVAIYYRPYGEEQLPPYLQMIDSSGNLIYPGLGIEVSGNTNFSNSAQMSSSGNDIYIVWHFSRYALKGQRISNGQVMWGPNGKVLLNHPESINGTVIQLRDRYIIFTTNSPDPNHIKCYALKIDANGDPETGWPAQGLEIIADTGATHLYITYTALLGDDLVIFSYSTPPYSAWVQRISAEGTRLWTDAGITLPSSNIRSVIEGEALTLLYQGGPEGSQLLLQKIDGDGNLLYGNDGYLIAQDLQISYDAKLLKFANGNLACVWSSYGIIPYGYRDLYLRYISPQGTPLGDGPELLCNAWLEQTRVRTAVIGNSAMVAWNDGRSGILDSEDYINSVYATRIEAGPTSISDLVLPAHTAAILRQNYPNPFNPETSLAFQLPRSGSTSLGVYNMKGQLVRTLYANQLLAAGDHTVVWDGCDAGGRGVGSGIYLYRLIFADQVVTRKMLLAK